MKDGAEGHLVTGRGRAELGSQSPAPNWTLVGRHRSVALTLGLWTWDVKIDQGSPTSWRAWGPSLSPLAPLFPSQPAPEPNQPTNHLPPVMAHTALFSSA